MAQLPISPEILAYIGRDENRVIDKDYLIKSIDKIIPELKKYDTNSKDKPIEKIDPFKVFTSWNFIPLDKIRKKPTKWREHYKENIFLVIKYLAQLKNHADNKQNISQDEIKYIHEIIKDLLLLYIDYKSEFEHVVNNNTYEKPSHIVQIDHNLVKHIKLNYMHYGNSGFKARELIPITAFEIRQIIETGIYNSFGLNFAYKENKEDISTTVIPMKVLFEFLSQPEIMKMIRFFSKRQEFYLNELKTIYSWSNSFIHTGIFPYYWQTFYASFCLHEFSRGIASTYNTNSAIQINRGKISEIQKEFLRHINKNNRKSFIKKILLCDKKNETKCYFGRPSAIEVDF